MSITVVYRVSMRVLLEEGYIGVKNNSSVLDHNDSRI